MFYPSSVRQNQIQPLSLVEPSSQGSKLWSTARMMPTNLVTSPMPSPSMDRFSTVACIYNITGLLCLDQFYSSGFNSSILKQHTNYLQMPLQPCSNFSLLDQREVQKVQGQLDAEKRETSSACKRVEHQIWWWTGQQVFPLEPSAFVAVESQTKIYTQCGIVRLPVPLLHF